MAQKIKPKVFGQSQRDFEFYTVSSDISLHRIEVYSLQRGKWNLPINAMPVVFLQKVCEQFYS